MHLVTDEYFIDAVMAVAQRIRDNSSPVVANNLACLTATAGRLADELILRDGDVQSSWKPVWQEAIRVAAMAMLIATDGDTLGRPNHVNTRDM